MGWNVIVFWECELKSKTREETLNKLVQSLNPENNAPLEHFKTKYIVRLDNLLVICYK